MTNPKLQKIVLTQVAKCWKKHPELRLGQLLGDIAALNYLDVYYMDDAYLIGMITKLTEKK